MDLIDRSKINFYHLTGPELRSAIEEAPTVPAVPLEPLAKWIVENLDPRYFDCEHCSEENVCYDCPTMTEQQVKEKLKKWMEEQNAADRR